MMNVEYITWRVCAGDVKDPRVGMGKKKEVMKKEKIDLHIKENLKEATVCMYIQGSKERQQGGP